MRGRRPTPSFFHELHGRPGKRARKKSEPLPIGDLVDAPDWFTAGQRERWKFAIENSPPGLLKQLDRGVLVVWAVAAEFHEQAARALQRVGQASPDAEVLRTILSTQARTMMAAGALMGFSPVARRGLDLE